MIRLDDPADLCARDPGGMLRQVASLPEQLERAAAAREALRGAAPDLAAQVRSAGARDVLVCGMGGSAIGGDYAAVWARDQGHRVSVWRGYGLPAWADARHLLIFSSYSGNTEETLAAFDAAPADAVRVCITTGGALAQRARDASVPHLELPAGLQPRAALGHSLVALLAVLAEAKRFDVDALADLHRAAASTRELGRSLGPDTPESSNIAKQLARRWHGRLPFLYAGAACLAPVARRWKGQLNENAKIQAVASWLPEMNHNEIVGWSALDEVRARAQLVFLPDPHDEAPIQRRMQLTKELLEPDVAGVDTVDASGTSVLEHMLTATHLGDYASVYLAFLNGVDPTPVERIDALKRRLADGS